MSETTEDFDRDEVLKDPVKRLAVMTNAPVPDYLSRILEALTRGIDRPLIYAPAVDNGLDRLAHVVVTHRIDSVLFAMSAVAAPSEAERKSIRVCLLKRPYDVPAVAVEVIDDAETE